MITPSSHGSVYRFGTFEVFGESREIFRNGYRVKLQDQPFQLLLLLLESAGGIVDRELIRQRLWPENTFVDFGQSLGTAVTKLRQALGDDADNPRFVETIPRRGYRFIAPVKVDARYERGWSSDSCRCSRRRTRRQRSRFRRYQKASGDCWDGR